jgi:hypothetical protein
MIGHEPVGRGGGAADRRWLLASLAVIATFMFGEVIAGQLAHSLALLSDAGHLLTDVTALLVAVIASRIAERPARGAYTYGFARVDALSGQANGITLVLLAAWFTVEAIRRLINPPDAARCRHRDPGQRLDASRCGRVARRGRPDDHHRRRPDPRRWTDLSTCNVTCSMPDSGRPGAGRRRGCTVRTRTARYTRPRPAPKPPAAVRTS